jgi:hypothetical protein
MTAIHAFPLTPDMQARLAARDTAVTHARTILRSPAPHAKDDVRLACHTLMTFGDQWDWAEAYPVLRALDAPPAVVAPVAVAPPAYSAGTGTIRRALVDLAGLAVIVGVALAVYLARGA